MTAYQRFTEQIVVATPGGLKQVPIIVFHPANVHCSVAECVHCRIDDVINGMHIPQVAPPLPPVQRDYIQVSAMPPMPSMTPTVTTRPPSFAPMSSMLIPVQQPQLYLPTMVSGDQFGKATRPPTPPPQPSPPPLAARPPQPMQAPTNSVPPRPSANKTPMTFANILVAAAPSVPAAAAATAAPVTTTAEALAAVTRVPHVNGTDQQSGDETPSPVDSPAAPKPPNVLLLPLPVKTPGMQEMVKGAIDRLLMTGSLGMITFTVTHNGVYYVLELIISYQYYRVIQDAVIKQAKFIEIIDFRSTDTGIPKKNAKEIWTALKNNSNRVGIPLFIAVPKDSRLGKYLCMTHYFARNLCEGTCDEMCFGF